MGTLSRISTRIFVLIIFSALLSLSQTTQAQCTFLNGDFESGTVSGWTTYIRTTTGGNFFNYADQQLSQRRGRQRPQNLPPPEGRPQRQSFPSLCPHPTDRSTVRRTPVVFLAVVI